MAEQVIRDYSDEKYFSTLRRISWGAIFAGLIVAIMVSLILSLLGLAIGAATVNPMSEANPMSGLGIGAVIWLSITTLIAYFAGGCVAGRLAGVGRRADAMLHGVVTWGLATIVTLFVFTSAVGGLLGGTANLLSGVAGTTIAPRAEQVATSSDPSEAMKNQMKQLLQAAGQSPAEAEQAVETWAQRIQQGEITEPAGAETERAVREAGETMATGTSRAAWGAFIALILGALAAAFGGRAGIPRELRIADGTTARAA